MKDNYQAWGVEPLSDFELAKISKEELYRHLIGWAILAPSTHNAQPWRFRIKSQENSIEIFPDRKYILPVSDPTGRQSHISLGAALENLLVAASCYGFKAKIEYEHELVAVALDDTPNLACSNIELLYAIKNRRVNREKFDAAKKIPHELLIEIKDAAKVYGVETDFISDTATRFAIAELQYLADRYAIAKTNFRNELADYLLPNDTDSGRGMPGNTFKLSDDAAAKIHELLKTKGLFDHNLASGFAIVNREAIKSSPLVVALSVSAETPERWIKAGQALQKIALLCETSGLALAINAALVEAEIFNKLLKTRLARKERPTVIIRIGYPTRQMPHSPRVNVEEVIENRI